MARELGEVDVDAMLTRMTSSQLIEWMGFFIVEKQLRTGGFSSSGSVETDLRAIFGRPKK